MAIGRLLNDDQRLALEAGLDFAARIAHAERPLPLATVQELYDGFLEEEIEDRDAIIALGLSFGQCILDSGPFEWVLVEDEYGEETSLAVIGATLYLHPIAMIRKRLERREAVVFEELCNDTLAHMGRLHSTGDWGPR